MKSIAFSAIYLLVATALLVYGQIEITLHPDDTEAFIGKSNVSLHCSISNREGSFDQWLHNGQPIISGADYDVSETQLISVLEIKLFRKELAGEYRCQFISNKGTHTDVALTLPAMVRYFGQDGFSEHPKDFDSYVIEKDPQQVDFAVGRVQREVIAFECSYQYDPLTTQPTITWQTCNSDGSFTDVPPATNIFTSPDPREGLEEYVFFQTNFTAYLQLINSTNLGYNGTRYRCKAVSNIPGDTTEVFSNCATITQFDDSVPLPDTSILPVFRTIPKRDIYVTENIRGVMACTIQNRQTLSVIGPLVINNQEGDTVIINYAVVESGLDYIPVTNVEVNYFDLFFIEGKNNVTYTCQLDQTDLSHQTTFHLLSPPTLQQARERVIHTVSEDASLVLTLRLQDPSLQPFFRTYKNGQLLTIDGTRYQYTGMGAVHTLTIASARKEDRGVFQLEVQNLAGKTVLYNHIRVSLKARPLTQSQTIEAKVTQTLELECMAMENGGGSSIDFKWESDSRILSMFNLSAATNRATSTYSVSRDLLLENAGVYTCTPSNVIGSKGSVSYTVTVTKFDFPSNVSVSVDEDNFLVIVRWNPIEVDQTRYPGANVGEYVVEIHAITTNGQEKVGEVTVRGNTSVAIFRVNSVLNYQARVKGRTGGRDVSDFSPFSGSNTVTAGPPVFEGWKIFLIIFFILLFILCLILLLCLLIFCLLRRRDSDSYDAEEREKQYQEEKAQIST